jgi:3-oxoacyl-[acyl-carrier-protein] synthase-3
MASILSFGSYLPDRILGNAELAASLGCEAAWIEEASGVVERRIAGEGETVAVLAERAARDCMERAGVSARQIGAVLLSSGTSERRFPGPASELAHRLGLAGMPAIDLPIASAGALFGIALGAQLAPLYGTVLVVAAERMSAVTLSEPPDRNTAILFGDGAGACLVTAAAGGLEVTDTVLHSDGAYADDLRLDLTGSVKMNGRSVIMQAVRRIPSAITEVLDRQGVEASAVRTFLMHQANRNLIDRVAKALNVPVSRFFSNIRRCGNTSSASMLIAASEWRDSVTPEPGDRICFAAFGAGFHWGAILARQN